MKDLFKKSKVYIYLFIFLFVFTGLIFGITEWEKGKDTAENKTQNEDNSTLNNLPEWGKTDINPASFSTAEFLDQLKISPDKKLIIKTAPTGWINKEDIFDLLDLIDSQIPCSAVWSEFYLASSYIPPDNSSTIGNEAMYLLEGYINGRYPSRFYSNSKQRDATGYTKDYKTWWNEHEKETINMTDSEKFQYYYSLLNTNDELEPLKEAIIRNTAYELFSCLEKPFSKTSEYLQKYGGDRDRLLNWAFEQSLEYDPALKNWLILGTGQFDAAHAQIYSSFLGKISYENPVRVLNEIAASENDYDITSIINFLKNEVRNSMELRNRINGISTSGEKIPYSGIIKNILEIEDIDYEIDDKFYETVKYEQEYLSSDYYNKDGIIPLFIRQNPYTVIGIKPIKNEGVEGEIPLLGIPQQKCELFFINMEKQTLKKAGIANHIISTAISPDNNLLALVYKNGFMTIDTTTGEFKSIDTQKYSFSLYNANWDKDNDTLYIHGDTLPNYFVYSHKKREIIKTRGGFEEDYLVYRGTAAGIPLYSRGQRVGVADGLYLGENLSKELYNNEYDVIVHDILGDWLLLTVYGRNHEGSGSITTLKKYNITTGEYKNLETYYSSKTGYGVYKAAFLHSTGDVIYTTFNMNDDSVGYILNRIDFNGNVYKYNIPSPLFILTPGETFLSFSAFTTQNNAVMKLPGFIYLYKPQQQGETEKDVAAVRDLMIKAYSVYCSEKPDIEQIENIFVNTYDPIPQEALENIMLEIDNEGWWRCIYETVTKDMTIKYGFYDNRQRAHVTLGSSYFRGPHELVKIDEKWFITGFSTWPDSRERQEVYKASEKIVKDIVSGSLINTMKSSGSSEEWIDRQIEDLQKISGNIIEIGEIELWQMSDPHRAISLGYIAEARVKIIADNEKYIMHLSREWPGAKWRFAGLSELGPGMW